MNNPEFASRSNVLSAEGIAATSQPLSSLEAISVLKKGGNAIDAAIAASAVQSVVEPNSTGLGGDCFALISINGEEPISVNGSGIAPKQLNFEYLKKNNLNKIDTTSPHSVTIPGAVHAWKTMHNKYGKLDFEELFINAENYARFGYPVHEKVAKEWSKNLNKIKKNQNSAKVFLKNGEVYKFGEIHKNIQLANTIKSVAKNGTNDFYHGFIAQDIVDSLNSIGGCHTMEDFASQKTIVSKSINSKYKNIILHQCPPNGPGISVLMMMAILEKFNITEINPMSFERFHLQAEVTKVVYEEREKFVCDPKYFNIDTSALLETKYINSLYKKISLNNCYKPTLPTFTSHPETIYITVVDKDLNCVSFINSICYAFGSGITTKNTGILLQNRGVNFRLEKNHPNCIEGHKRPLHTIIPGMVFNIKNQPILSYGVMGGQYQPVGHCHVLQNFFDFNMSIQESIDFPRAFCLNEKYQLENRIPNSIFEKLEKVGHNVNFDSNTHGGGQAIYIDRENGVLVGGSDYRKDGCAIGI